MNRKIITMVIMALMIPTLAFSQTNFNFNGEWELLPEKSNEIGLYNTLSLDFDYKGQDVTIIQKWGTSRSFSDTLRLKTDGKFSAFLITDRVFPANVFMGLSMNVGDTREIKANWEKENQKLKVEYKYQIRGSQGNSPIHSVHTYELSPDGEVLTYEIKRSTRKSGPDAKYLFKRSGTKHAYFMHIKDEWEVLGGLDKNAFLISLQGVANVSGPNLYFIYPKSWPFTYTASVFEYYKLNRNYTFHELKTLGQALDTFKDLVKGYVVWDKSMRTSLIVAFTVAGLERAVVVSEELIPIVEQAGLKMVEDFRGKFTGRTDAEIYTWAYEQYWDRCNKEFIVWMGGDAGKVMKPGVAD